ncbi:MAG: glycosyltransferase [Gammaproteobacteria bacterium]|nr:glycosyltransferase [Gammaproteobacteria bacterium]
MRVAHVITRLIVGGAQENTLASVLGLRGQAGLEVELLAGPTTGPEGSLEGRAREVPGLLTVVPSLVRAIHPWHDARAYLALRRHFHVRRPDLVHTHSGKAGILGRWAAHAAGVPLIVHTIHGPSFGPFQGALPNAVYRTAERWAGRMTTHFVVVAHAMRDQYLAAGIGRAEQYTRIWSGFPLEAYLTARPDPGFRARLGLGPEDVVVGKMARLFRLKGHDDLLAVAPRLWAVRPNLKLLLVGDGEWRPRFEARVAASGWSGRVVFAGLVPPEAVPQYVGAMDVLVHLSRREGLARALPQALAAGKPVVAYDCDGAREVCLEGETGFLVRPGDLATLTQRLVALADDAVLRRRLGERGRALVAEAFPVERMVADLAALYRRLGGARSSGEAAA